MKDRKQTELRKEEKSPGQKERNGEGTKRGPGSSSKKRRKTQEKG